MKCIISTTYLDTYLYFLPITVFCWNKLNVDVICFMPDHSTRNNNQRLPETEIENRKKKYYFILDTCEQLGLKIELKKFSVPEHKEATAAQCIRLYGACLDLPESEQLIISDIDMVFFSKNYIQDAVPDIIDIYGADLVPDGQFPMCYLSGYVKTWRDIIGKGSYQEHLDNLLGGIECENMRGNYWSKDQQTIWELLTKASNESNNIDFITHKRARSNTQFADHRVDRDDTNWRAYVNDELIDAHLWRPGYTDEAHANIMELLRMKFPDEDFTWLDNFRNEYKKLL